VTSILVTPAGERLICSFTDPAIDPDPRWLPLAMISSLDAVLVDVRWPEGAAPVLDAARAAGRPGLLDADVAASAVVEDLALRASHALFSEPGLAVVAAGLPTGAALRRLWRETHAVVGVTLGSEGFVWLQDGREHRLPAPPVNAIDTLAAGDVWHGAFALGLVESRDVRSAAAFANAAASIKCQRPGGRRGAPRRAEVELFLAGQALIS
jgi:sulfofructose kinase